MKCQNCGASLTPEHLQQPACPFCGNVLPYYARAAEKAAIVKQLLSDDDGDGIPDVFAGMVPTASCDAQVHVSSHVVVNGQVFTNPADLPPAARAALERAGMLSTALDQPVADQPLYGTKRAARSPSAAVIVLVVVSIALVIAGLVVGLILAPG